MIEKKIPQFASRGNPESYKRVEEILDRGPFLDGTRIVHRAYFVRDLGWIQAGSRITEMNRLGWVISSIPLPKHLHRNGIETGYRLDSKLLEQASGEDWFVRQTGKPRPSEHPWRTAYSPGRIAADNCFQLTAPIFGTSTAP
jgi:hypothetical protein